MVSNWSNRGTDCLICGERLGEDEKTAARRAYFYMVYRLPAAIGDQPILLCRDCAKKNQERIIDFFMEDIHKFRKDLGEEE